MCNCNCCKQRRLAVSRDQLNRIFPTKAQLSNPGSGVTIDWGNVANPPDIPDPSQFADIINGNDRTGVYDGNDRG